ncbi:hypothetical protein D3C85_1547270 [compost metagenome]
MSVGRPSARSGSIWKMPPWAQSLAWIFMLTPGPLRCSSTSVSSTSTSRLPFRATAPRLGVLLANKVVGTPPVISSGFGAPVRV